MTEMLKIQGFLSWCIECGLLGFALGLMIGWILCVHFIGWSTIVK